MSDNKEKITETIGIISAIVGIVKLIIGLFEKKRKRGLLLS
jgi:hypothetical protein